MFGIKNSNSKEHRVNEEILASPGFNNAKQVRVVGPESEQLGIMSLGKALEGAFDRGLDLVLIAPQADTPVCRIMDYGRFRFERDKKDKEARKKQQIVSIKEVQLSCHIDVNDFNTKLNHARRFLGDGDKVRVVVRFRGRQMTRQDTGYELLAKFEQGCSEFGAVEKKPVLEGRTLTMFIAPLKTAPAKAAPAKPAAEEADDNKKDT